MKVTILLILLVLAGGIIAYQFYTVAYRPLSLSTLEHVRAMAEEAVTLRDSAVRLRREEGSEKSADRLALADRLEGEATMLQNETEVLQRKRALPSPAEVSERFRREAQRLSDSAVLMRQALLGSFGSLTTAQQRALDRIDRYAASALRTADVIVKTRPWPVNDRLEVYDVGLLALIEGRRAAFDLKYLMPGVPAAQTSDNEPQQPIRSAGSRK